MGWDGTTIGRDSLLISMPARSGWRYKEPREGFIFGESMGTGMTKAFSPLGWPLSEAWTLEVGYSHECEELCMSARGGIWVLRIGEFSCLDSWIGPVLWHSGLDINCNRDQITKGLSGIGPNVREILYLVKLGWKSYIDIWQDGLLRGTV